MSAPESLPKEPLPAPATAHASPGWELPQDPSAKRSRFAFGGPASMWTLSDRLDSILPPHKRYFGRSRRTLLIVATIALLLLLALIVGLAVGLTQTSRHRNLPLPDGAQTYTGDLTYYEPGLGACGVTSTSEDNIVSISHFTFDAASTGSDPNANPLCGRKIRAQRTDNGKTASLDLTVVDRCVGCAPTDIDVSPTAFDKLAAHDLGRVPVTWAWL